MCQISYDEKVSTNFHIRLNRHVEMTPWLTFLVISIFFVLLVLIDIEEILMKIQKVKMRQLPRTIGLLMGVLIYTAATVALYQQQFVPKFFCLLNSGEDFCQKTFVKKCSDHRFKI